MTLLRCLEQLRRGAWAPLAVLLLGWAAPAQAAMGTLFVDSAPGPAHVYVDGKYKALTPFTMETAAGKYSVMVKKQDYVPEKMTVLVQAGKVTKVTAELTPGGDWVEKPLKEVSLDRQTGTLTIMSDRPANVWIDNRKAMNTAPLTLEGVTAGPHSVILRYKGREVSRRVTVHPGGVDRITLNFGESPSPAAPEVPHRDWSYPIAGGTCVQGPCGPGMCYVPAGEFYMGCSEVDMNCEADERPYHRVIVDAFCIDQKETTNPYNPDGGLSWHDAARLCQSFNKRLPTEAEWEKAARGPYGQIYPMGSYAVPDTAYTGIHTKDGNPSRPDYTPWPRFGASKLSPYGLMNTAGGLWEWTQDWYDPTYYRDSVLYNPKGPAFGKATILRGGGFAPDAPPTRASFRYYMDPEKALPSFGVRCAASVVGPGH